MLLYQIEMVISQFNFIHCFDKIVSSFQFYPIQKQFPSLTLNASQNKTDFDQLFMSSSRSVTASPRTDNGSDKPGPGKKFCIYELSPCNQVPGWEHDSPAFPCCSSAQTFLFILGLAINFKNLQLSTALPPPTNPILDPIRAAFASY